jgi:hypothetical protein
MAKREIRPSTAVADRIVAMLGEGAKTPAGWREIMAGLEKESGARVYAVLLFLLTQLDFAPGKRTSTGSASCQWQDLPTGAREGRPAGGSAPVLPAQRSEEAPQPGDRRDQDPAQDAGLGHLRRAHPALQLPLLPRPGRLRGPPRDPLRHAALPADDRRRRLQGRQRRARPPRRQHPPAPRYGSQEDGARGGRVDAVREARFAILLPSTPSSPLSSSARRSARPSRRRGSGATKRVPAGRSR